MTNGNGITENGNGHQNGNGRNHTRYSDEFRASAVLLLVAAGYPDKRGALAEVAKSQGIPEATLRSWFNGLRGDIPAKLCAKKEIDLVAALRREAAAALGEMEYKREGATYKDLGVVLGIMVDKLQLLSGEATERFQMVNVDR